jgi:hypothetical protein
MTDLELLDEQEVASRLSVSINDAAVLACLGDSDCGRPIGFCNHPCLNQSAISTCRSRARSDSKDQA